jgi:hypothetical protein
MQILNLAGTYVLTIEGYPIWTSEDLVVMGAVVGLGMFILAMEALRGWLEDRDYIRESSMRV